MKDSLVGLSIIAVTILLGVNSCHIRKQMDRTNAAIIVANASISNLLTRMTYQTIATEDLNKRVAWRLSTEDKEPGSSQTDYAGRIEVK